MGSQITRVVLPILVFQLTGSALQISLLYALQTVPNLVFGLVAGAIADRFNRRGMIVGFNVLNGAILATIPILDVFGTLTVTDVYVATLLATIAWVWSDAADFGAFPAIVGRDRIVLAWTVINSTWTIAGIIALPIGGLLAATIGPATTITLDAVSYLVAAIGFACIPRSFGTPARDGPRCEGLIRRTRRDIRIGLSYIRHHVLIGPLTVLGFFSSLTSGAILGLLVVYGVRQLGLADEDVRLGWLYAAGTGGALVTALALRWLVGHVSQPRICLVGFTANFVLLVGLALSTNFVLSLVLLFAWQGVQALTIYNLIALRQQLTPNTLQSRVNTTGRMLAAGGQPIGAVLGGVVADALSIKAAMFVMAAGVLTSAICGWLSPLRSANTVTVSRLMADADAPLRE